MEYSVEGIKEGIENGSRIVTVIAQPALEDQTPGGDLAMNRKEMEMYLNDFIGVPIWDRHEDKGDFGKVVGAFISEDAGHLVFACELHGRTEESREMIRKVDSGEYPSVSLGNEYTYAYHNSIPVKDKIFTREISFLPEGRFDSAKVLSAIASKKGYSSASAASPTFVQREFSVTVVSDDGKETNKSGKFIGPWYLVDQIKKTKVKRTEEMSNANAELEALKAQLAAKDKEMADMKAAQSEKDKQLEENQKALEVVQKEKAELAKHQKITDLEDTVMPVLKNAIGYLNEKGKDVIGYEFMSKRFEGLDDVEKVFSLTEDEDRFNETVAIAAQFVRASEAEAMRDVEMHGVEQSESAPLPEAGAAGKGVPMNMEDAQEAYLRERNRAIEDLAEKKLQEKLDAIMKEADKNPKFSMLEEMRKRKAQPAQQMSKELPASGAAARREPVREDVALYSNNILRLATAAEQIQRNGGKIPQDRSLPGSTIAARKQATEEGVFPLEALLLPKGAKTSPALRAACREQARQIYMRVDANTLPLLIPQDELERAAQGNNYTNFTQYVGKPAFKRPSD